MPLLFILLNVYYLVKNQHKILSYTSTNTYKPIISILREQLEDKRYSYPILLYSRPEKYAKLNAALRFDNFRSIRVKTEAKQ